MGSVTSSSRVRRKETEAPFPPGRVFAAVILLTCLVLTRQGCLWKRSQTVASSPAWCHIPTDDLFRPLDLNTASFEELTDLPGIGERRAEAILRLRYDLGFFLVPEDLLLCPAIGNKQARALLPYVTTSP